MIRGKIAGILGSGFALAACASGPSAAPRPTVEAPTSAPVAIADAGLGSRIDAALDAALRERRVVGAVVLVAKDGRVIYRRAVGKADRERDVAMKEDAIFRYASISKPIVATAALALIDRGALRLDDPVTRYLPDFRPRLSSGDAPTITVRHLFTHTSGLGYTFTEAPGGPYHRADVSDGLDVPGRSFDDNAKRLVSVPLRDAPGAAFHYSLSTDVLGAIVAKVFGAPLPDAVAALVTKPLALRDTGFRVIDESRLVPAYADGKDGPVRMGDPALVPLFGLSVRFAPSRALDLSSYPSGGAGMVGTAGDFLVFLEALRTRTPALVSEESSRSLAQNQLGASNARELGEGVGFGFISAVVVDPARAKTAMGRGTMRWGGAYGHAWFVDREAKLSVVLMTNTAFEGMIGKLPNDLEHAVYGR